MFFFLLIYVRFSLLFAIGREFQKITLETLTNFLQHLTFR
jgi:hypothetical protein